MTKYRKKPEFVDAITFDELVEHGKTCADSFGEDGMPWSFYYNGYHVTHEDNDCFIVGIDKFLRGELLTTTKAGVVQSIARERFLDYYEPAHDFTVKAAVLGECCIARFDTPGTLYMTDGREIRIETKGEVRVTGEVSYFKPDREEFYGSPINRKSD